MWDRLPYPWRACLEEAWTAYCAGSVPVGAVITDQAGTVLVRGRNQINELVGQPGRLFGHPLAHAELNALAALPYGERDPHLCILFTTTEPCPLCFGAFYMSGVRELRYAAREPYAGSVNLQGATRYLGAKPIRVVHAQREDLERVIVALTTEYIRRVDARAGGDPVLRKWREVLTDGVELGERLFASGWLQRMREQRAHVGEVVEQMAALT